MYIHRTNVVAYANPIRKLLSLLIFYTGFTKKKVSVILSALGRSIFNIQKILSQFERLGV